MSRGKRYTSNSLSREKIYYILGVCALTVLLIFIFALSGYKSKKEADARIAQMEESGGSDATMVSSTEDKTINEVKNESNTTQTEKVAINTSILNTTQPTNTAKTESQPVVEEKKVEEPKVVELHFSVPVQGEIAKDFSDSNLTYSETLQEWTVHLGIDIKADKGSSVVASEAGTVESIKNDPRYGLTVTIAHANGFKSIYSNLQTAEFVSEGQTVEKGKIIGSVGDNAAFEIADEPHLHFEMTKDDMNVNPTAYWEK